MKKLILGEIISILILTGCSNKVVEQDSSTDWINKKVSENKLIKLYELKENIAIYSKLDTIEYKDNDNIINLKDALEDGKITIDDLISKMNYLNTANDGGSSYYESNDNFIGEKFYLAKCNSLEGNGGIKDIFIDTNEENIYNYCVIE